MKMSNLGKMFTFIMLDMMDAMAPTVARPITKGCTTWFDISELSNGALLLIHELAKLGVITTIDQPGSDDEDDIIFITMTEKGTKLAVRYLMAALPELEKGCFGKRKFEQRHLDTIFKGIELTVKRSRGIA